MDKWKDTELEKMKIGGNYNARCFFESQEDYDDSMTLMEKYNSKAAALYRDKVRVLVSCARNCEVLAVCSSDQGPQVRSPRLIIWQEMAKERNQLCGSKSTVFFTWCWRVPDEIFPPPPLQLSLRIEWKLQTHCNSEKLAVSYRYLKISDPAFWRFVLLDFKLQNSRSLDIFCLNFRFLQKHKVKSGP